MSQEVDFCQFWQRVDPAWSAETEKETRRKALYDGIATQYVESLSQSWVHRTAMPSLLDLLAKREALAAHRICDIGCGPGNFTRLLARAGAREVVGIDVSAALLSYARCQEDREPLGITYLQADVQDLVWQGPKFHAVSSNVALLDMHDLFAVAKTVAHMLVPGGLFVFSVLHPCGPHSLEDGTLGCHDYYKEGYWRSRNSTSVRGQVGSYHRRLATYIQTFLAAGFVLEELGEPQPIAPRPSSYAQFPAVLVMCWRKARL